MVVRAWNRSGGMKANPFLFVHWGGVWIRLAAAERNLMHLGLRGGGLKGGVHVNCSSTSSLTRGTRYVSRWVGG